MDNLYKKIPLQIRTFVETLKGDTTPITKENLSSADLKRLEDTIADSRKYKTGLLDAFHFEKGESPPSRSYGLDEYEKYFKNQKALDTFKQGSGNVDYGAYLRLDNKTRGDVDISPSASIMNTLGRFAYTKNPDGTISVKDSYDFKDDRPRAMSDSVSKSDRYKDLSNMQKLGLVAKETFVMPNEGFDLGKGIGTLPSRLGNAFIGEKTRPVDITFMPSKDLSPDYFDREENRIKILRNLGIPY